MATGGLIPRRGPPLLASLSPPEVGHLWGSFTEISIRMKRPWVWVDLENTPHVLFLEPIIRRLRSLGWEVRVSARPQAQTLELAAHRDLAVRAIGLGDLKGLGAKVIGVVARASALAAWILRQSRPASLVSCSRSASLAALVLRIPGVALLDYEHAEQRVLAAGNRVLWLPDLLRSAKLPPASLKIARYYEGLKENLYLDGWVPDRAVERRRLGVADDERLVVSRPPAESAHYASDRGGRLWIGVMQELRKRASHKVLIVARTPTQRESLARILGPGKDVEFLTRVVCGPALVGAADLVIGGGGTMNREAAVLGVPVWSVFTGPTPLIDDRLADEGRLRWVRTDAELAAALAAEPPPPRLRRGPYPQGLTTIVENIEARLKGLEGARE